MGGRAALQQVNHEFSIQNEDFPALPGMKAGEGMPRADLGDDVHHLTGPLAQLGGGYGQGLVNMGALRATQASSYEPLLLAQHLLVPLLPLQFLLALRFGSIGVDRIHDQT